VADTGYHFVNWTGTGFIASTSNPLMITNVTANLTITANFAEGSPSLAVGLNHSRLNFAKVGTAITQAQTLRISSTGYGTLHWTATPSAGWIVLDKTSGSGAGKAQVSVNPSGLGNGTYQGTITITDPAAGNSPQTVAVSLAVKARGANPFGLFETPANNATGVTGSIAVTGWVVDDVEVTAVQIYRSPLAGEGTAPIYIGDAGLVEGARPDVEALYADSPFNYRAGWGYMMLTNFLPNGGNGTFTLTAYAVDRDGHRVALGSKRITCDNAHATLPFGAIDTPSQGGAVSGSSYVNFGWALTPQPATIPMGGSTLWVWVDGAPLGHPTYNQYREDIATLFPGYTNSVGAIGYFPLNPSSLAEGVHTIAWSARDDLGREDGIGSRYFSVSHDESSYRLGSPISREDPSLGNPPPQGAVSHDESFNLIGTGGVGAGFKPAPTSGTEVPGPGFDLAIDTPIPLRVKRGFAAAEEMIYPDRDGVVEVTARTGEPLAIELDPDLSGRLAGIERVGADLRPLPIGSRLDPQTGLFTWLPGPGFRGTFALEFLTGRNDGTAARQRVRVRIE